MTSTLRAAIAFLALAIAAPATAETFDLAGAQTYSDICLNKETSIPHGGRIFVRRPGMEPRIVIQPAFVELLAPYAARSRVTKAGLAFTGVGPTPATSFKGEIRDGYAQVTSMAVHARTKQVPLRDETHGFADCP